MTPAEERHNSSGEDVPAAVESFNVLSKVQRVETYKGVPMSK